MLCLLYNLSFALNIQASTCEKGISKKPLTYAQFKLIILGNEHNIFRCVDRNAIIYEIFTFPLRDLKWTFTFAIRSVHIHEQHRFKRRYMAPMDARHFGVPTSRPSNNVVCLLTFTSYHHDVERGDFALWLFRNLRYDWYNSKFMKTSQVC